MKNKTIILLLLVLIIAGFLRLYQITTVPPGLYPDEAMNGNNALQALRTNDFRVFYTDNNGREGLFINIQALFLKFFNANSPSQISSGETWEGKPWVLRLPSAIFGILTVLGIYFLAKELFSARVGLLSAFFLATSFWHINFSRIGFRAILAPFFLVWALYFLIKAFSNPNSKFQIPNSVIAGIFYGLGFYTYIAYRVTPVLILFVLLFYWVKNKELLIRKKILVACCLLLVASFIVALPLGIYFLQHPADFFGRTSDISILSSPSPLKDLATNTLKTLGMLNFAGDYNWRHNYAGNSELFWPVGILFIIGIILGIKSITSTKHEALNSKQITNQNVPNNKQVSVLGFGNWNLFGISNFGFIILFLWFFLAMLPVVISNEGIPHALRSILMIPPVIMLSGIGGIAVYNWLKKYVKGFLLPLASIAFLAVIFFQAYYSYFIAWANNPNVQGAFAADYVALGRKLNSLPANVPKYVVVGGGGVQVNGIPMPAQTVMFITNTFLSEGQKAKNIRYILPGEEKNIPAGAETFFIR
ncbi:MAG: glycosyltransferase family 39 protein [Patescibacteria group bacterium]